MTTTLNGVNFNAIGRVNCVQVEPTMNEKFLSAYRENLISRECLTSRSVAKQLGLRIIKFIF